MDFIAHKALIDEWRQEAIQSLTKSDFGDLEKVAEKSLPEDFISHYLQHNGQITSEKYSFWSIHYGISIERFMHIQKRQGIDFGKKLAFASDLYGHTYVLSLEDDSYGQVFHLRHEHEDKQAYDFVSDSFTAFMNDFVSAEKTFLR